MAAGSVAKASGIYVVVRIEHNRGIETVRVTIVPKYQLDRKSTSRSLQQELFKHALNALAELPR